MFIQVYYKDGPELSSKRRESMEVDNSIEKTVLVNPDCPVRIMLEYLRKKCRLGVFTNFDLSDEHGQLRGLFEMPTYAYATEKFCHTKVYYIIVLRQDGEKPMDVFPQVNAMNPLYELLLMKVKKYLETGVSSMSSSSNRTLSNKMQGSKTAQHKTAAKRKPK